MINAGLKLLPHSLVGKHGDVNYLLHQMAHSVGRRFKSTASSPFTDKRDFNIAVRQGVCDQAVFHSGRNIDGHFTSPSPSWRGSDAIRVLLFSLTLRSGRAILRYDPRLLSSWPTSSTDAPQLRSIPEAVESSFPLRLQPHYLKRKPRGMPSL